MNAMMGEPDIEGERDIVFDDTLLLTKFEQLTWTYFDGRVHIPKKEGENSLGKGTFGIVVKANLNNPERTLVAVKIMDCLSDTTRQEHALREASVLFCPERLAHRNILRGIEYIPKVTKHDGAQEVRDRVMSPDVVRIILPFYHDNLRHLVEHVHPSPDQRKHIIFQIFDGLRHMHDVMKIRHGDIKLENILYKPSYGSYEIAIADFGTAASLWDSEFLPGTKDYADPGARFQNRKFLGGGRPAAYDVWSAGLVAAELLKGGLLTEKTPSDVAKALRSVDGVDTDGVDLVLSLLAEDPERRPSMSGALAHKFFDSMRAAFFNDFGEVFRHSFAPDSQLSLA